MKEECCWYWLARHATQPLTRRKKDFRQKHWRAEVEGERQIDGELNCNSGLASTLSPGTAPPSLHIVYSS